MLPSFSPASTGTMISFISLKCPKPEENIPVHVNAQWISFEGVGCGQRFPKWEKQSKATTNTEQKWRGVCLLTQDAVTLKQTAWCFSLTRILTQRCMHRQNVRVCPFLPNSVQLQEQLFLKLLVLMVSIFLDCVCSVYCSILTSKGEKPRLNPAINSCTPIHC